MSAPVDARKPPELFRVNWIPRTCVPLPAAAPLGPLVVPAFGPPVPV
jgi:hypothetical protein